YTTLSRSPRCDQQRQHHTHTCTRIEYTCRQRPFLLRKPFGYRFHARREIPRLPESQTYSCERESCDSSRCGVKHSHHAPYHNRYRISHLGSDAVNEPAETQEAYCIGCRECRNHRGKIGFRPLKLLLKYRLQQPDDLPVNIIDGRCQEE